MISSGLRIFSRELFKNVKPTSITRNETISAAIYSIRPCPNGCSLSAGLFAIFTPTKLMTEDAASERLLNASAIIARECIPTPISSLAANSNTLQQIPTILDKIPYLVRTSALPVFSYSFTKHLTRKSVMGSPSFNNTFRNFSLDKKGLTHRREALIFFLSFSIVGSVEKKVKPNIFSEILLQKGYFYLTSESQTILHRQSAA